MAVKKEAETNYCTMQLSKRCNKEKGTLPIGEFYSASDNVFYKNGRFNICKNCLKQYVYLNGEINISHFKNILRIYDIPFFKKEWESAVEDKNETIGVYFKNIFLNHKQQNWLDGDLLDSNDVDIVNDGNYDKELIQRWGYGFSNAELEWLEHDYHEWTTHHDCEKLSIQRLVQMICIKELEIRNARQSGKPTDKLEKSLRELMNDTNLTPKTMSAVNETDSSKIYGVWIKDIEQNKPAEFFKDKKIYHDFDGIEDYFNRFILRPMKNLLTGSRDFDKEFMIEDDEKEESNKDE